MKLRQIQLAVTMMLIATLVMTLVMTTNVAVAKPPQGLRERPRR